MTALDLAHLKSWIGRSEVVEDRVDVHRAAQMAGALGMTEAPALGDELPMPWHWLYFQPVPHRDNTGQDGHPARGDFLPPVPLPRRMWAGSDVVCHRAPQIGEQARRVSRVESVEHKVGRSGDLVFVTVVHTLQDEHERSVLEETQHIVYREAAGAAAPAATGSPDRDLPDIAHQFETTATPDAVMLFRYSALTFNGHRIHYDRDYAVNEEGYPGLVVHGPLIASLLLKLAYDNLGHIDVSGFSFRARRPLFDGAPMLLRGALHGEQLTLWALTPAQELAMRIDARVTADVSAALKTE